METHDGRSSSGIVLSPLFNNLYTSDIPKSIVSELALYADDICIYDQSEKPKYAYLSEQHHLNDIGWWDSRYFIKINAVPFPSPERIRSACLTIFK